MSATSLDAQARSPGLPDDDLSHNPFFAQACYLDGQWIAADDGATIAVDNPARGTIIGSVPRCLGTETARAISAAHQAFILWKKQTAEQRGLLIGRLADAMAENIDDLARILTIEMGKPLAESQGEITGGIKYLRFFAEQARRIDGDIIPSPWPGRRLLVIKEPIGVAGAITPWNFPNSMIARKLGAALAAGCTVVIKPASQTPFSALAYGKLAEQVGFPPGVINVITGTASAISQEMCTNPLLRKITFTGSTEVGKKLAREAAGNMKKISMELGGNAPFIVFADADIPAAVEGAFAAKFRNSGQTCVCANRLYVHEDIYDQFSAQFAAVMEKEITIGDGLAPGTTHGPLIDSRAVEKIEEHIADAHAKGGQLKFGGQRHARGGSYFEPTLITEAHAGMKVATQETFAPLATLFRFSDEQEVIRAANDTAYGLACYFYTRDLARSFRVMEELDYGLVGVNVGVMTTEVAPFGGHKDSGFGSEGSKYGVDDYMTLKYCCLGGL